MVRLISVNILVLLILGTALIGFIELISYVGLRLSEEPSNRIKKKYKEKINNVVYGIKNDELLSYIYRPNVKISLKGVIQKKEDSKWVFSHVYCDAYAHTDNLSRRVIPFEKTNQSKDSYLLFFGGSRTFGYGVNDNETYPYYVSREMGAKAYSYSSSGWGPGQFLALLQKRKRVFKFDESNGLAIYFMVGGHIGRLLGLFPQYYKSRYPKFDYDKRGRVALVGNHVGDGSKLWQFLKKNSQSFNFFLNGIQPIFHKDYEFTADVINEIQLQLKETGVASRLLVVLAQSYGKNEWKDKLMPLLKERKIEFLNTDGLFPKKVPYILHELDAHLSPLGNEILAKSVTNYLKNQKY